MPQRTLARRVDGAFPSVVNPVAIWEIKEYYYTTTFLGVVSLMGYMKHFWMGWNLKNSTQLPDRKIHHLLVVDDHFTWWECGRSYLCRIIDMLHMGYVDEVIFGREVLTRLPQIARQWKSEYKALTR